MTFFDFDIIYIHCCFVHISVPQSVRLLFHPFLHHGGICGVVQGHKVGVAIFCGFVRLCIFLAEPDYCSSQ